MIKKLWHTPRKRRADRHMRLMEAIELSIKTPPRSFKRWSAYIHSPIKITKRKQKDAILQDEESRGKRQ